MENSGGFSAHIPLLLLWNGSDCFWRGNRIAVIVIFLSWISCFQSNVYHNNMWLVTHLWTAGGYRNLAVLVGQGLSHAPHRSVTYWGWVKQRQICLTRNGLVCLEESKNMTLWVRRGMWAKIPRFEQRQKADGREKRKGKCANVNNCGKRVAILPIFAIVWGSFVGFFFFCFSLQIAMLWFPVIFFLFVRFGN